MAGTAFGGFCYATQFEAAAMWCAALNGVTPSGVVTCSALANPLPSQVEGGASSFNWKMRVTNTSGVTTNLVIGQQLLQSCEPYDFAYYSPLLAAFTAAVVAISAGRWVYRLFTQDRETM